MISFLKYARRVLIELVGRHNIEGLIVGLARLTSIDLLVLAYHQKGILKYWNDEVSGEKYVLEDIIARRFAKEALVIFDVGANIGDYSKEVRRVLPKSRIYAFEPNSNTFDSLVDNVKNLDVDCFCLGLSSSTSRKKVYTYASDPKSQHASMYREVLAELHGADEVLEIDFETISLDEFCDAHKIGKIDFLKIDTEGHELEVLSGAQNMLSRDCIGIIQFEFNEMNVISRTFLKDFYQILVGYNIYRIDSSRLIPMFDYSSSNEIFQFQNLLAIKKSLDGK